MADGPPLLPSQTLAEALAYLRGLIPAMSPIQNRDPFGVWETYLTLAAQVKVDDLANINAVLPQGFVQFATGSWLDEHAASLGLQRIQAQRAEHLVMFSVRQPGTVPVGTIVQTELGANNQAQHFRVPVDTEVPVPGGPVRVVAEQPGTQGNVGAGRIQTLVTVLPFVTGVSNAADSLAVAGVDAESDKLLRDRLRLRWPAISRGSTYHSYISWSREVPGIVKVSVLDEHPRGQGTVDVIVAAKNGLPTPEQLADVDTIVQARRPLTANVLVRTPKTLEVDVALTLYLHDGADRIASVWAARVQEVFDAHNIGETFYPSRIDDALHNYSDVAGVVVASPARPLDPHRDELVIARSISVVFG